MMIGWSAPGVGLAVTYGDFKGCAWYLHNGGVYGNTTGHTNPGAGWNRATIGVGTKIGMLLDFNSDGIATVTVYKDGVRAGVLSACSLRGPLCPAVWFNQNPQSVEF